MAFVNVEDNYAERTVARLSVDDPLVVAAKKLIGRLLAIVESQEAGVLQNESIESLHQTRIAIRKMRSVFRHVKPVIEKTRFDSMYSDLRYFYQVLGEGRDLDSFISYLEHESPSFQGKILPAVKSVIHDRKQARASVQTKIHTELTSQSYLEFKNRVKDFIGEDTAADLATKPLSQAAPELLQHDLDMVLAFRDNIRDYSMLALHQLRIEAKHLRYLGEFFQEIYTPDLQTVVDQALTIQRLLGKVQDTRRDIEFFQTHSQPIKNHLNEDDPHAIFMQLIMEFVSIQTDYLEKFFLFWEDFTKADSIQQYQQIIQNRMTH